MGEEKKTIESVSLEERVFPIPEELKKTAYIKSRQEYEQLWKRSIEDPEGFWAELAEEYLEWFEKWNKVWNWDPEKVEFRMFEGAKLNVSYNCLDKHIKTWRKNKAALGFVSRGEPLCQCFKEKRS